jgi:hypothetical protein
VVVEALVAADMRSVLVGKFEVSTAPGCVSSVERGVEDRRQGRNMG